MNNLRTSAPRIYQLNQRVRVLMSCAHNELEEERRVVYDAIRNLKLYPIMLENDPSSVAQQEVGQTCVEQGHIYIGVFWKSSPAQAISSLVDAFLGSSIKPRLIYVKESPEEREPELERFLIRIHHEGTYCYRSFSTSGELAELVQDDIMQLLSETFSLEVGSKRRGQVPLPDYLQELLSEIGQYGLVKREVLLQEVQEELATNKILLLVGDPGIGKSYLLGVLGAELNATYISLRNKTTQQVCAYLANYLSQRRGQLPQNLLSEDESRAALQQELADTVAILLLDDADDNPSVARALLGLEFFACRAVFAVCSPQTNLYRRVKIVQLSSFTREEVTHFLSLHNMILPPGEFQRLYTSSQGNPLYLFYFTQQQISPLPENLEDYQRILWEKLSPLQQEALAFLAHSLAPLSIAELHTLLNMQQQTSRTVMETKSLLTSAAPLIHQTKEMYEFFHTCFAEFIRSVVANDGLSSHYHQILGEHAIQKQWTVATAYHLLHANDSRMKDFLISGAQIAILRGEFLLTEQFLLRALLPMQEDTQKQTSLSDINAAYEEGAHQLVRRLDKCDPYYADALAYQQRLMENITKTQRYGDTENRRAERAEIIDLLNELTLSIFNQTFLGLCKEWEPSRTQTTGGVESDAIHQKAYIRYLLAQVYLELGRYRDARREVNISIALFEETKEEEWKALVEIWSNLLLLEEGQTQQAIEALERVVEANQIQDVYAEAYLQVNLSCAYLRASLFRKGAEAAKHAADLFKRLGDTRGVYASLTNLAGNIGHLGAYTLQRRYAEQIIQAAVEHHRLRLRCAGLNLLAVAQRSLGDPLAAQACLEECIRISQEIGSVELEVLNIINLGNAFRDQDLEAQAESAYTEALTKARQNHLTKHEAHALELLARLKFLQRSYEASIELGRAALALQLPLGEHLRIAVTQDYLARCYQQLGQQQQAAEYYEESGKQYEVAELWSEATHQYGQAVGIWNTLAENNRALYCITHGATCAIQAGDVGEADRIIGAIQSVERSEQMGEFYLRVLQLLLEQRKPIPFTMFMYNFSAYCKRTADLSQKRMFQKGLDLLVAVLAETRSDHILNALAISIEQTSEELLSSADGEVLAERISQAVDHLHYRHDAEEPRVWTIGLDWQQPLIIQITCLSEETTIQRVAMALALVLLANHQRIEEVIIEYGGNQEKGFALDVVVHQDLVQVLEEDILSTQQNKALSAAICESNVPWGETQPPTALILHDDYKLMHNWATHPENKAFVWVLMLTYSALIAHCSHQSRETVPSLAKKSSKFCHEVLDFGEHQDETQDFIFGTDDL